MSYQKYIDQLKSDGCAVIENFLTENEIADIQNEISKLIDNFDYSAHRTVFSTGTDQSLDQYFLDSVDKISYFFEKDAFNEKGELIVPKKESINKIGHCLHMRNELFKKITFSDKVKELVRQLGYKKPIVPQSMFIFKNAKVGGQVVPHKDGTYLYTEPDLDLVGLWFPMVDVNLKNGCLSYVKGSHLDTRLKLFVRDRLTANGSSNFINEDQEQNFPDDQFTPIEVKAGSCVLIHGLVVHQSKNNTSNQGRPVYTFHLLDMHNKKWADQNWLQETDQYKFPLLYETN